MGITRRHWYEVTTLHAGLAPMKYLQISSEQELQQFISSNHGRRYILGGGSNTIGSDTEQELTVLRYKPPNLLQPVGDGVIRIPAGIPLCLAIDLLTRRYSCGGMAALAGIPGTIGGACAMNAGANGHEICEFIHAIRGINLTDSTLWQWHRGDGGFGYRRSPRPDDTLITAIDLSPQPCVTPAAELSAIQQEKLRRQQKNPRMPSAGSVFRNPGEGAPAAGALLEQCGCKELQRGRLRVSAQHANWIVNPEGLPAAAEDARWLVKEMQRRVYDAFGISLKTEWRFV